MRFLSDYCADSYQLCLRICEVNDLSSYFVGLVEHDCCRGFVRQKLTTNFVGAGLLNWQKLNQDYLKDLAVLSQDFSHFLSSAMAQPELRAKVSSLASLFEIATCPEESEKVKVTTIVNGATTKPMKATSCVCLSVKDFLKCFYGSDRQNLTDLEAIILIFLCQ